MNSLHGLQDPRQQRPTPIGIDEDPTYSDEAPLLEDVPPPGTSSSFLRALDPTNHWLYLPSGLPRAAAFQESLSSRSSFYRGSGGSQRSRGSWRSKTEFAG